MADLSGKVQSVLGLLDPHELGRTYTHEHLSVATPLTAFDIFDEDASKNANLPFEMKNLGWIRQYPYSHKPNLVMKGNEVQEAILEEMKYFKKCGGGTIVENTTFGIEKDLDFMVRVARETGVNVIAGAGYYVGAACGEVTNNKTVEQLAEVMKAEILEGCDGTDGSKIKCGVIGELGCSWPLQDCEKKVLQAAALVQKDIGCPVIIHPGRDEEAPFEIIRVVQEAGGDVKKTVMSHLDRTIFDDAKMLDFAALGSYCELDLFGIEVSLYQCNELVDMPSDAQRIQMIKRWLDAGYGDRVVVAHDIHTKHRLMKYGGHGYSHILNNVVPCMLKRGISQKQIDAILIDNPRDWLTFKDK